MAFEKIAEIIFPNVEHDREYYIAKYPKRNLKEGARVTRYAPSPTGFQHIGGVFAALINERLSQSFGCLFKLSFGLNISFVMLIFYPSGLNVKLKKELRH